VGRRSEDVHAWAGTGARRRRRFPPFLAVPITLLLCALLLAWAIERGREFGLI
jgi:hypothetical protein